MALYAASTLLEATTVCDPSSAFFGFMGLSSAIIFANLAVRFHFDANFCMGKQFEHLVVPVTIKFRSSDSLSLKQASMQYDAYTRSLQLDFVSGIKQINIASIKSVKAMDYVEGTRVAYVIILTMKRKDEDSQISEFYAPEEENIFHFPRAEDRDTWDTGLRYLLAALDVAATQDVSVPARGYSRIKKVKLDVPRAGVCMSARFELANGQEELMEVKPDAVHSKDGLKHFVVDWVQKCCVLPSETTSLYRLVKSLVHRAMLESKAADVIRRINECHFDHLLQANSETAFSATALLALQEAAKAKLGVLERELNGFVGQHGTAAFMVTQMLKRNVDKMKVINELSCALHMERVR